MSFTGIMKMRKMSALKHLLIVLPLAFICLTHLYAADAGQYLSGDLPDKGSPKISPKEKSDAPFLMDSVKDGAVKTGKADGTGIGEFSLPESTHELDQNINSKDKKALRDFGIAVPGSYDGHTGYLEHKNKDILEEVSNLGKRVLSLTYITDKYDYKSQNNIFQRTFDSRSRRTGYLFLGYDHYFFKNPYLWLSIGGHGGFSYNSGKGIFANSGNRSQDADIKLWTVPVDLSFSVLISPFNFFDLVAAAGPSVMGAIQSRSDFQEGEARKNRRQVSPGYFYSGSMKINLSRYFRQSSVNMYNAYRLSRFFLTLDARYHEYKSFQDADFSVSGMSFGGGFAFEFL